MDSNGLARKEMLQYWVLMLGRCVCTGGWHAHSGIARNLITGVLAGVQAPGKFFFTDQKPHLQLESHDLRFCCWLFNYC